MGIVLIAILGFALAILGYSAAGPVGALGGIIVGALLATVLGKRNTSEAIGREVGKAVASRGAAPAPVSWPQPQQQTVEDRLASLDRLRQQGLVNDEEYAAKRTQIIESL